MNKLGSVISDKSHPWERYLVVYNAKINKYQYVDLLRFLIIDSSYNSLDKMDDGDVVVLEKLEV